MEDQYVLVLGAGLMQKPSIEAAKTLGYRTLVVDANPDAPCAPYADRFEPIDLKDKEGIAALAKSMGSSLRAVFTAGTDFSASVAYVAEQCSLVSHPYAAALNASDKLLMRGRFAEAGVPSPSFTQISRTEIASFIASGNLDDMTFPKVVKPVDNMGARGCRMIRSREEFLPAVEEAVRASRTGRAILEDYMAGNEFSIDAIVHAGTLTVTGFADRHIFYEPYFIEMGHTMPTDAPLDVRTSLIECFASAVCALGLTEGAAKADIKYTERGPMIGEVAARLSGGYMSGWTYPYASSLDLTKEALLVALGKEPEELLQRRRPVAVRGCALGVYEVPCVRASAERAWVSIPGKVRGMHGEGRMSAVPFVRDTFFRVKEHDRASFPRNNVEKCGNAITSAPDRETAVTFAEQCASSVVLRLCAPDSATESFLSGKERKAEKGFPPPFFALPPEALSALDTALEGSSPVPRDSPLSSCVPELLSPYLMTLRDPNHRTLGGTIELFDKLCPSHAPLPQKKLWHAVLRGGIQGALYVADEADAAGRMERRRVGR